MMRIPQPRLAVLDRLSGGRVGELARRGERLRYEIDVLSRRLLAHQDACWLVRRFRAGEAEADRRLMMIKREEAALLTCELVRIIAEAKAGGYSLVTRSE